MTTDALKDFRGPEPVKASDDLPPTPPVADDDHSAAPPVVEDVKVAGVVEPKKDEPAPTGPKLTPFDQRRADIAARFATKRVGEGTDTDMDFSKPENVYGKLAGDGGDPPADEVKDDTSKAPATPGPSASEGDAKPEPMTLAVNGKTVAKTLAEVAALADMTEDEVKADPARAKKYAQRELATADNLERSRIARRDLPARQPDDAGTRPASPGPDQDRREAGNDDHEQPPARRNTSVESAEKLLEEIQIGDPKEVAPKLAAFIASEVENTAKRTMEQGRGDQLRMDELRSNTTAVKELLDEHPELAGNDSYAAAIKTKLEKEYRTDLRNALIAEGDTEEEAEQTLSRASPDQVRNAHLARRLNRDPHVRQIDKALMNDVYEKVRADLGGTAAAPKQQDLSRQDRKEALPLQPRRAAVPPATTQAPPAPISRKAAVAEMAARTGRKPASLNR